MHLRFSRLRWPDWVVGAGGLVLLGSMLLPWFSRTPSSRRPGWRRGGRPGRGRLWPKHVAPESADGWHRLGHARWLMLVTVLEAFKVVFLQARQRAPALPVAATEFAVPLAAGTGAWLLVWVGIAPSRRRELGGWIGLLGAAAIAYGGYRSILMEGIAPTDAPAEIPTVDLERGGAT